MIRHSILLLPLALLPLAPLPAATRPAAPESGAAALADLAELVAEQVELAGSLPVDQILARALGLRDVAGYDEEPELDRILDGLVARPDELSPKARLLVSICRLQGEDADPTALIELLLDELRSADEELALASAGLFANTIFKRTDSDAREGLSEVLFELAEDSGRGPDLRIAAASAAHALGGGAEKRRAREQLMGFLVSSDADLRARGALALAGVGEEIAGTLARELERLASLPGASGALARAYLKQEDIRQLHESRMRALDKLNRDNLPTEELRRIHTVMGMVRDYHLEGNKFDDKYLMSAALDGMLRALDQHSSYMDSEVFEKFNHDLEAEYGGIGAYVGEDPDDGLFTITKPIYSGPAYRAGLGTDDKIVRIDDWSTVGQPTDEIIKRLKGKPGTPVILYVWTRGMDATLIERPTSDMIVEVTRERISIPAVQHQMLPGNVGLVSLTTFSRVASQELRSALSDLLDEGMEALIFDMRYNSGGLLIEAREVGQLFLPKGSLVVTTDSRIEEPQPYYTTLRPVIPEEMPMAVLVNRFSASASEIVAGALADHERAAIVGERTYGKGSVQTLIRVEGADDDRFYDENNNGNFDNWEEITVDWDKDGEFDYAPRVKMTIARYLLPSGRSIHREVDADRNILQEGGIKPGIEAYLERVEAWRIVAQRELDRSRLARHYVEERWENYRERFVELAECDFKEVSGYPDFEEFYLSLDSVLSRDDVRFMVRREVRRLVQDERGAEFPIGDFQEDAVVQAGLRQVFEKLGRDALELEPYAATFGDPELSEVPGPRVAQVGVDREGLDDTLALIQEAREGDGHLSREALDSLLDFLSEL